jgi:hypothetical protein
MQSMVSLYCFIILFSFIGVTIFNIWDRILKLWLKWIRIRPDANPDP